MPTSRQTVYSGDTSKISKPSVAKILNTSSKGGIFGAISAFCAMCVAGYNTITSVQDDVESRGGHILSPEEDALAITESATEAKSATATDAVIGEEEEPKCKEICFEISTINPKGFTYPDDMEDIYGNIVPKPPKGKKTVRNAFSPPRLSYEGAFAGSIGKTKKQVRADKDNYDGESSIHHIRPVWAGGDERTSTNLALMENDDHNTMHEWWHTELEELAPDINKKIENCAKENGKYGGALNACKVDESFQNPKGKAQKINEGEDGITHLSTCLAMQGVTLNVSVDEPCSK
jgi:hypothetical protein